MRVILLTHGGADLVIKHLAMLKGVELVGVFIETVTVPPRSKFEKLKRSIKYDGMLATAAKLFRTNGAPNFNREDLTRIAAAELGIAVADVENYHSSDTVRMLKAANADLGVIFGTNIIKETVFSIPSLGSINLHQGLAPFYRGGPPVFWELFNDEPEVGLTAHFVAAKVDTGDIVLQTKVPLEYDRSFGLDFDAFIDNYRAGLREDSARLIANAVAAIALGHYSRTTQDTSLGNRYRLPTKREKDELRRRLKARLARGAE